jgi:hypothetical protein
MMNTAGRGSLGQFIFSHLPVHRTFLGNSGSVRQLPSNAHADDRRVTIFGYPFSLLGNEKGNWVVDVEAKLEMYVIQVAGIVEFAALHHWVHFRGNFPRSIWKFDDLMTKS